MVRRMKGQDARQPCPWQTRAYRPEGHSRHQSPETNESTPDIRRLNPQCAETAPPRDKATRPGIPDEDQGLCKTEDFAESRTSWDSGFRGFKISRDLGLRGTRDIVGSRTPQKTGTLHTSDQDRNKRTQTFRINLKHGHHLV